jgi:GT2 family glycosyltransferase
VQDLAIIILNYNTLAKSKSLVNSLIQQGITSNSIYLIDNNSNDQTEIGELAQHKKVSFIQSKKNTGYAAGNYLGIEAAITDGKKYLLLLNPDIQISYHAIESLYTRLAAEKKLAVAGPRICYKEQPDLIYSDGGVFLKDSSFRAKHLNNKKGISEAVKEVKPELDYINGSALMFKKEVLDAVGYMRTDLFMYYEESEWCLRIKKAGWQLMVLTNVTAYHESSNKGSLYRYYMLRNRLGLVKLYYPEHYWREVVSEIKLLLHIFVRPVILKKEVNKFYFTRWRAIISSFINPLAR